MTRLRVLISSHEFSPYQGSECAVGWNISTGLAKYHDVTVLCADGPPLEPDLYRNAVIDHANNHSAIPGLRVVFVKQPPVTLRYARINRGLMALTKGFGWQPIYYMGLDGWHREAFRIARQLGFDNFDVLHQLTPISFLRPGYLWTTDKPFFWGPIGGMFKVPNTFARLGGIKSRLFERVRSANIERQVRSSRFYETVRTAQRIWVITDEERRIIDAIEPHKASMMLDTAPPKVIAGCVRKYDGKTPLRLCWSGRHDARKALPLLLHALASMPQRDKINLDVLGQGPDTQLWMNIARTLGVTKVTWHGRLPYQEALKTMAQADVFVHTSIKEAASMVVLEALGWGMPVICHDACGMAVAVNETCGIKVPFMNPETSIRGFRNALEKILQKKELVAQLSQGALRRASELSWEAKVQEIGAAYSRCVQKGNH